MSARKMTCILSTASSKETTKTPIHIRVNSAQRIANKRKYFFFSDVLVSVFISLPILPAANNSLACAAYNTEINALFIITLTLTYYEAHSCHKRQVSDTLQYFENEWCTFR